MKTIVLIYYKFNMDFKGENPVTLKGTILTNRHLGGCND